MYRSNENTCVVYKIHTWKYVYLGNYQSSRSRITNSTRKINLSTFIETSSMIPLGWQIEWLANWRVIVVSFGSSSPIFWKILYGIRLMLTPKLAKAFSPFTPLFVQGPIKLPRSFSLFGSWLVRTTKHSSLRVTINTSTFFIIDEQLFQEFGISWYLI